MTKNCNEKIWQTYLIKYEEKGCYKKGTKNITKLKNSKEICCDKTKHVKKQKKNKKKNNFVIGKKL